MIKETTRITIQFDSLLSESQKELLCELMDKNISKYYVIHEQIVEVEGQK